MLRVPRLRCRRCGHRWIPRKAVVTICPRCKTRLWQTPRPKPKPKETR